jgi:hypothetical protein
LADRARNRAAKAERDMPVARASASTVQGWATSRCINRSAAPICGSARAVIQPGRVTASAAWLRIASTNKISASRAATSVLPARGRMTSASSIASRAVIMAAASVAAGSRMKSGRASNKKPAISSAKGP